MNLIIQRCKCDHSSVYTHAKFKEVQFVSREKLNCFVDEVVEAGIDVKYRIRRRRRRRRRKRKEEAMVGQVKTECMFKVKFNRSECFVGCSCLMFEFKGLLCLHALTVLNQEKVTEVSSRYVLDPWRNDIRLKCCSRS